MTAGYMNLVMLLCVLCLLLLQTPTGPSLELTSVSQGLKGISVLQMYFAELLQHSVVVCEDFS